MAAVDTSTTRVGSARSVSPRIYLRVVWFAAAMLAGIIFTGAAVRLTQSGLGCEDWPTCSSDRIVPEWSFHSAIEFGNRLLSGVVSVAVAAAVLTAHYRTPRRLDLIRWSWGLVAGVVAQIVLGGMTVLADLQPLFVAAHFLLSAVLMWNVLVLAAKAKGSGAPGVPTVERAIVQWSRVVVVLAAAVLIVGTLVTGSGPHGGDTRADRLGFALVDIVRLHSIAAWSLIAATIGLAWMFARSGRGRHSAGMTEPLRGVVPNTVLRLLAVIVVQGAIGYWQYAAGVPARLVELHVIGAVGVWCAALWMHLQLFDRGPMDHPVTGVTAP